MKQPITEIQQRWQTYLNKIKSRFYEVLEQTEAHCRQLVIDEDYKTQSFLVTWQAVNTQLKELLAGITNTWQDKVRPMLGEEEYNHLDLMHHGIDLEEQLHEELELRERLLMGKIAVMVYEHTMQHFSNELACSQCKATIAVSKNYFRAHYVNCSYCNTVNTYTPSTAIREIEWFCVNHMAAYYAHDKWLEYRRQERQLRAMRNPSHEAYVNRNESYIHYYIQYLQERIKIIPDLQQTFHTDLESKIQEFTNH